MIIYKIKDYKALKYKVHSLKSKAGAVGTIDLNDKNKLIKIKELVDNFQFREAEKVLKMLWGI